MHETRPASLRVIAHAPSTKRTSDLDGLLPSAVGAAARIPLGILGVASALLWSPSPALAQAPDAGHEPRTWPYVLPVWGVKLAERGQLHRLSGFLFVKDGPLMFRAGGYGVVPLLPKGDHAAGDLLPNYAIVPWTFADLSLPVWEIHRDFIGIRVNQAKSAQKIGLTNYPGWSAYWLEGVTFVKQAPVISGAAYSDLGCVFETFTNGEMIELETLGPLTKIAPGASATHVEHWGLLEGLPRPDSDVAFARLAAAVKSWLGRIGK